MTHDFGTLAFLAVLATLAAVSWLLLRARRRNARHAEAQIRAEHQDAVARLDRAARELVAMSERTRAAVAAHKAATDEVVRVARSTSHATA